MEMDTLVEIYLINLRVEIMSLFENKIKNIYSKMILYNEKENF